MFGYRNNLRAVLVAVTGIALSALPALATDEPTGTVLYDASVATVYQAEQKAFGVPPTRSDEDSCVVTYKSSANAFHLLWTATCRDEGGGKTSVTLKVEGQWFFGVGTEERRVTKVFWSNMDLMLKPRVVAPNPSPLASPAPAPAPSPLLAPAPALKSKHAPQPKLLTEPPAAPAAAAAPSPAPAPQAPAPQAQALSTVHISSNPTGADIIIDGDYDGNTPSQLRLSSGSHSLRIIKKGYQPWERSIKVEVGDDRSVDAELEKFSQ